MVGFSSICLLVSSKDVDFFGLFSNWFFLQILSLKWPNRCLSSARSVVSWSLSRWHGANSLLPNAISEKRICLSRLMSGLRARGSAHRSRWRVLVLSSLTIFSWNRTSLFVVWSCHVFRFDEVSFERLFQVCRCLFSRLPRFHRRTGKSWLQKPGRSAA